MPPSSTPQPPTPQVAKFLAQLQRTRRDEQVLKESREGLEAMLLSAMKRLLPPGEIVDLRDRDQLRASPWLIGAEVSKGNAYGSNRFEIGNVLGCTCPSGTETLYSWRALAYPLNQSGERMKAVVQLMGRFAHELYNDDSIDGLDRQLISLIERAEQAAAPAAPQTPSLAAADLPRQR